MIILRFAVIAGEPVFCAALRFGDVLGDEKLQAQMMMNTMSRG
jgi:hypothetical protein